MNKSLCIYLSRSIHLFLSLYMHLQIFWYICIYIYINENTYIHISSVEFQSLSRVQLFATPWTTACQAALSITNSQSSLKLTSLELVMPSSHLILCRPLLLLPPIPPSIRVFSNESTLLISGQSTGVSALASFLPKKSQGWLPSEWTGWISLQSKGLSRVFSNTTVHIHMYKWKYLHLETEIYG